MTVYASGRYNVVRYADARGTWYAVIDTHADSRQNIIYATRSRKGAHSWCANRNSQPRELRRRREAADAASLSGSDWFHAGMPS